MHFAWQQILLRLFCSTPPIVTIWRALHSLDSGVYINNLKHGCRWYRKNFTALWSCVVLDAKTWANQAKSWRPIYQSKFLDFWWPHGSLRLFCSTLPIVTIWRALHSLDSRVYINNLKHGCRWYRKFFTALWSFVVLDAKTWSNQAKSWRPIYQSKLMDFCNFKVL